MSYPSLNQGVPYGRPSYDAGSHHGSGQDRTQQRRGPPGYPPQVQQRNQNIGLPPRGPPQAPRRVMSPQDHTSRSLQPSPRWPLQDVRDSGESQYSQYSQASLKSPPPRGPPPQRPPRPNDAPSMLQPARPMNNRDNTRQGQPIPQYQNPSNYSGNSQQGPGVWGEDGYTSPTYPSANMSRPMTMSSRGSTSSEFSLPDIPVPQIPPTQHVQQRRPPLGPPPSARRGPASYYPQHAHVTPIVEETDSQRGSVRGPHDSRSSFASSNAIPIARADYYMDDHLVTSGSEAEAEAEAESPVFETRQDGRESRLGGREEPVGLVRQASLGKRSKPTLTTIKSSDSVKSPTLRSPPLSLKSVEAPQPLRTKKSQDTFGDLTASDAEASLGAARENTTERRSMRRPALSTRTNSSDAIGKASVDASASESEKSIGKQKSGELLSVRAPAARTRPKSPLSQSDPRVEEIIGGLEKGGALTPSAAETLRVPEREGKLSERVGARRPPRLNVDAVRDAEARGSLTSLPDLIRRATKLASNLDRGRTASRLGLNMFDDIGEKGKYPEQSTDKRRSGSISDILASFPPPGLVTPGSRGSRGSKPLSHWPSSGLRHSTLPSESDPGEDRQERRRCCGMPMWLFVVLMLILVLLIAAAIIVPIVLIVIPHQNHSSSSSTAASCASSLPCQNGGTNILGSDGSCRCLCVNGFTGQTCATASGAGCTTTDIDGTNNATVGDAIPRLLQDAKTNFTIALDGSTILGLFSATNLSCTSENALVTFNGLSERSLEGRSEPAAETAPTKTLLARQDSISATVAAATAAATSNGIVFQSGSPTATASSSAASSSASSDSSLSGATSIDFARVAVLFVLQDSGELNDAISAQEAFTDYFGSGTTETGQRISAQNITLGGGYTADLVTRTVLTGNGTTVGAST